MSDFNVLKHDAVPYHEVLDNEKMQELLETYHIKIDQLPKILDTDPVARAIGAQPGKVLKVIRKSRTAGEAVAYRLVISASGASIGSFAPVVESPVVEGEE